MEGLSGTVEDRQKKIRKQGIFDKYKDIHKEYVSLIEDKVYGFEALKRALFIQWIGYLEPSCFTGIECEFKSDKEAMKTIIFVCYFNLKEKNIIIRP